MERVGYVLNEHSVAQTEQLSISETELEESIIQHLSEARRKPNSGNKGQKTKRAGIYSVERAIEYWRKD